MHIGCFNAIISAHLHFHWAELLLTENIWSQRNTSTWEKELGQDMKRSYSTWHQQQGGCTVRGLYLECGHVSAMLLSQEPACRLPPGDHQVFTGSHWNTRSDLVWELDTTDFRILDLFYTFGNANLPLAPNKDSSFCKAQQTRLENKVNLENICEIRKRNCSLHSKGTALQCLACYVLLFTLF